MKRVIIELLRIDYSLSIWLSKTKQTIVPGTAYLFLTKLAFLFTTVYFFVLPLLPFRLGTSMAISILCGLVALMMFGLQAQLEALIRRTNYPNEYFKTSNNKKVLQRVLGVILILGFFILMFVIGVLSYTGYGK